MLRSVVIQECLVGRHAWGPGHDLPALLAVMGEVLGIEALLVHVPCDVEASRAHPDQLLDSLFRANYHAVQIPIAIGPLSGVHGGDGDQPGYAVDGQSDMELWRTIEAFPSMDIVGTVPLPAKLEGIRHLRAT